MFSGDFQADGLGVFGRGRAAIDFRHRSCGAITLGDDQAGFRRFEVLGLKQNKGQAGLEQGQDGRIGVKTPLEVDMGFREQQIVTGRAAEQRQAGERLVQGGDCLLLEYRQTIHQEQAEHLARIEIAAQFQFGPQFLGQVFALAQVERGERRNQFRVGKQLRRIQADTHQRPLDVAGVRGDFARRGATDHRTPKHTLQGAFDGVQVKIDQMKRITRLAPAWWMAR